MDPHDWSIEDVVNAFCRPGSQTSLWKGESSQPLPNLTTFEKSLRDNEVNGSTLLNYLGDAATLKQELGIIPLGQRATIVSAIKRLQQHSSKYASSLVQTTAYETRIKAEAQRSEPITPTVKGPFESNFFSALSPVSVPAKSPLRRDAPPRDPETDSLNHDLHPKRRRLDLSQLKFVPPQDKNRTTKLQLGKHEYLGHQACPIDRFFYSDCEDGAKIASDISSDEGDFEISPEKCPAGKQQLYYRRLQGLMLAEPFTVDKATTAIYPYSARLARGPQAATVVKVENGKPVAFRRSAATLQIDDRAPSGPTGEPGSFDYLLTKYAPNNDDEESIPVAGASDSEGIDEQTRREMEEEKREEAARKKIYLTTSEVENAIHEALRTYELSWREHKQPLRENNARAIWRKGRVGKKAPRAVHQARQQLARFETRLEKLRRNICDDEWCRKKDVIKQCGSLEITVMEREELRWRLALWRQPQQPPRLRVHERAKIAKRTLLEDSEEDVDILTEDSLDEFIRDDGSEANTEDELATHLQIDPMDVDQEPSANGTGATDVPFTSSPPPPPLRASNSSDSVIDFSDRHNQDQDEVLIRPPDPEIIALSDEDDILPHSDNRANSNTRPFHPAANTKGESEVDHDSGPNDSQSSGEWDAHPEDTSIEELRDWTFEILEHRQDRRRLVLLILHHWAEESPQKYRIFKRFVKSRVDPPRRGVDNTFALLRSSKQSVHGVQEGRVSPHESDYLINLTRLFVVWATCDHECFDWRKIVPVNVLKSAREWLKLDFDEFYRFIRDVTSPIRPGVFSDDEDDPDSIEKHTPRKSSKYLKELKKKTTKLQREATGRRMEGEERARKLDSSLVRSSILDEEDEQEVKILLNPQAEEDEDFVYLNPHIARKIKDHQVKGIRFMWRELVFVGKEFNQGCLLAHTMGLGKTMQTIALLLCICETAVSGNERLSSQLPPILLTLPMRILILCPPTLIVNWLEEFRLWLPQGYEEVIGSIYSISSDATPTQRRANVNEWHTVGGVLLIGYEMLRGLCDLKPTDPDNDEDSSKSATPQEVVREQLLHGPNIVVADEAHKMKGTKSKIGLICQQFKTPCRVALTGSPLANHLSEYYKMVNWVAKNHLGTPEEFNDMYKNPIETGLYVDATRFERRKALKKLEALKRIIDPKVQRADVSVLKDDLPPKTEFVITMRMESVQIEMYAAFVRTLHTSGIATAQLLDWISVLGLLVAHPAVFMLKIVEREKKKNKQSFGESRPDNDSIETGINVEDLDVADLVPAGRQEQVDILETHLVNGQLMPEDVTLSCKTSILLAIVKECLEIRDQILIFSQHLLMLDYVQTTLQETFPAAGILRLDGATKMRDRQQMAHSFNQRKANIFLASTRAGGLGLNIPGANRVILLDFSFNPQVEEQAIGRAYRLGQRKPVFVYHLVAGGTFEASLQHKLNFKKSLAYSVVDKKITRQSAHKTADFLFEPKNVPLADDLETYFGKDPVLDKVLTLDVSKRIRELATTEVLHRETDEKLTEEEMREVAEMHKMEELRRTDPKEFHRKRHAMAQAAAHHHVPQYGNPYMHQPQHKAPMLAPGAAFPEYVRPLTTAHVPARQSGGHTASGMYASGSQHLVSQTVGKQSINLPINAPKSAPTTAPTNAPRNQATQDPKPPSPATAASKPPDHPVKQEKPGDQGSAASQTDKSGSTGTDPGPGGTAEDPLELD